MNQVGTKSQNQERNSFLLPALVLTSAVTGGCTLIALMNIRTLSDVFQNCKDFNCFKTRISSSETLPIFCVLSPIIAGQCALNVYRSVEKLFSTFQDTIGESKLSINNLLVRLNESSNVNKELLNKVSPLKRENEQLKTNMNMQKDANDLENTKLREKIENLDTKKREMQLEINRLNELCDRYRNNIQTLKSRKD